MKKIFSFLIIIIILLLSTIIVIKNFSNLVGTPKYIYVESFTEKRFEVIDEVYDLTLVNPSNITLNNLKYCKNLKKLYIISSNEYENLEFLEGLNLSYLYIEGKCIDWSYIKNLTTLNVLEIYSSNFKNTDLLKNLNDLIGLTLFSSEQVNLESISNLKRLQWLSLSTQNSDISQIAELKNLKSLLLFNIPINNLKFLNQMNNLSFLQMDMIYVDDYTPILSLNELTELKIYNNDIPYDIYNNLLSKGIIISHD